MEREIDSHEIRRPCRTTSTSSAASRVNRWRDAWLLCYRHVEFNDPDPRRFHDVFPVWANYVNWVFGKPLDLDRYEMRFYYVNEPVGPKEVFQLYFDENHAGDKIGGRILFNLYDFQKQLRYLCDDMSKNNQLLVNHDRGTINFALLDHQERSPAQYFKTMTTWHLFFVHFMHAMAHWDTYDQYEHANYDTHAHVRNSVFFKLYFYGRIYSRRLQPQDRV